MSYSPTLSRPAERLADTFLQYLHGTLLSIGFAVTLLLTGALIAGELPGALKSLADRFSTPASALPAATDDSLPADADNKLGPAMQSVADSIAKRYRIAGPAVENIVRTSLLAARSVNLDPILVLAVIGVESRFNPYSESPLGAQGLMQIIGKYHTEKFQPRADGYTLLDPTVNIRVGVLILKEYLRRTGNMDAALKLYSGESDENAGNYAEKVYAEKSRLDQVLSRTTSSMNRRSVNSSS